MMMEGARSGVVLVMGWVYWKEYLNGVKGGGGGVK